MDRRKFLSNCGAAVLFGVGASKAIASDSLTKSLHSEDESLTKRSLNLFRPATNERLLLTYAAEGIWTPEAYPRICWLLRDIRTQEQVEIDTRLIAILGWTQQYLAQFGYTAPLHILSGYRSLGTNAHTEGSSRNSMHLYGKAVDFKVPGLPTEYLGRLMAWMSQGGVGVYVKKDFVHVDTGSVRKWRDFGRRRKKRKAK